MKKIHSSKTAIFSSVFLAIALLSSTQSFAKQYYKWVDSKGSTHYTATPPPKSAKQKGKVETYGSRHSISENNAAVTPNQQPTNVVTPPPHQGDQQQRQANEALQKGQQQNQNVAEAK